MRELLLRYRGVLAVGVLLLLPLVLLYAQTRDPGARGPVVGLVVDAAGGIERVLLAATGGVSDLLQKYVTGVGNHEELTQLRRERTARALLEARITELERENHELRKLAALAASLEGPRAIGASIIGRSGAPLTNIARIDRGRADGVRRGDGVISPMGVVGRVLTAGYKASDVLLLTDAGSAADVVVQRTRARGIARGAGDEDRYRVTVEDFDRLADVVPGDVLVTSGLDPHLPGGLYVGTVDVVADREEGLYRRAEIVPAAPLSTVERVLVLVRRKQAPWPTLGGDPLPDAVSTSLYAPAPPEPAETATPDVAPAPKPEPRAAPKPADPPKPPPIKAAELPTPADTPVEAPKAPVPKPPVGAGATP